MKIIFYKAIFIFFYVVPLIYSQVNQSLENKFRLALSYEQINQLEKAESIYRELVNIQPWDASYFDALNKCFIKQKKYDESIEIIENRIKENPNDITLYGMLGSTYYMSDKLQSAFDAWDRGIQTNTTSFVVYRVIANYAIENRAFEKAIEILMHGKSYSTEPEIFFFDLANIYTASMQFEEATAEYCNMLIVKPDQIGIVKSRIASYIHRQGASESIFEIINRFIKENDLPVYYELLSYCYTLVGDYDNALKYIIDYEKKIRGVGTFIYTVAQESFRYRQFTAATKAYDYLIKNFPESPLLSVAKIGFAKTLEASLDQKSDSLSQDWKPLRKPIDYNKTEYLSIIDTYDKLAKEFFYNSIFVEATFRMAEVNMNRLYDYQSADSLYRIIIKQSAFTNYSVLANIARGKISIFQNNLTEAENFFLQALSNDKKDLTNIAEANFYLGRIKFWQGKFSEAANLFKEASKNLATDFSNDAIEYSVLINTTKRDSINLVKYANADLLALQNKLQSAAIELKTLADIPNTFFLNEFTKIKLAEIFITEDNFLEAAKILEKLAEDENIAIYADKSTFLLGKVYQFGINDSQKAAFYYKKILEKFNNSLYFDMARELFNALITKTAEL